MRIEHVNFDIPDPKRKLFRETWDLFGRASNLQDAVHLLEIHYSFMKDEKRKLFYMAAIGLLSKERDEIIEEAIEKYIKHKNHGL